ncbi:hypothetical protein KI387_013163, partial [Taxus chinensis]
ANIRVTTLPLAHQKVTLEMTLHNLKAQIQDNCPQLVIDTICDQVMSEQMQLTMLVSKLVENWKENEVAKNNKSLFVEEEEGLLTQQSPHN